MSGEKWQREREREKSKLIPRWVQAQLRARFHNLEIMTWAEFKSQDTQPTEPPLCPFFSFLLRDTTISWFPWDLFISYHPWDACLIPASRPEVNDNHVLWVSALFCPTKTFVLLLILAKLFWLLFLIFYTSLLYIWKKSKPMNEPTFNSECIYSLSTI